MTEAPRDIATTQFILPPDAKFLPVSALSARLRTKIGLVEEGQSVITRQGFRVTTRLVPGPLADLISEFREPSRLTDAVLRFARSRGQDPFSTLDIAFDALATLVEARILVPQDSRDAAAPVPGLGAGEEFAGFEIEALVRSLEDSEVYRARSRRGESAALKITRDGRPAVVAMFANEARMLDRLGGIDTPKLLEHGMERERAYIAMEWCDGVSIGTAAQQTRATRDRRRLHGLVSRMLNAYARLHKNGVLHGDIHPGNCLVRDDGRVTILDFGNARLIDGADSAVDPARAGIPQFHDPLMAGALLAGKLPPAATPASEQYAIAVLAYLLLTGLHPLEAPAVQDELLRRIAERAPLPFAARGVGAWSDVEAVIGRALAKTPDERFCDVAAMARAFAAVDMAPRGPLRYPDAAQRAFDAAVESVRGSLESSAEFACEDAWFALRAALALDDAELLAAADIRVTRGGPGWAAQSIAANIARAGSDNRSEARAISAFLAAAEKLPNGPELASAMLAAAVILEATLLRNVDTVPLASWAAHRLNGLMRVRRTEHEPDASDLLSTYVELSLVKARVVAAPDDLRTRLNLLSESQAADVWLWALAHEVCADDRFKALALAAKLPRTPLRRGFALLRLHQLTGELHWVKEARRVLARAPNGRISERATALLMAELKAPEKAIPPPFAI
ncbi:MAG TPA: AarF/UbiB family protein [Burkholderiales bacterium]|nr:AarF/UbiB family protein [Burkholderiales bacterium]